MKGDTLIEVLVALAVAVVVISAVTSLGIVSLNSAQFTKDQDQSTKYAQEGMEIIRALRNNSYLGFRNNYSGTYCLGEDATLGSPVASCSDANISDRYIRSVTITQNALATCGTNLANVAVVVAWTDSKCPAGVYCHSSRLTSCFSTVPTISGP